MVRVFVLYHIDRRHHVLDRNREFREKTVGAIDQPSIVRPSAFKHDFHLKPLWSGHGRTCYVLFRSREAGGASLAPYFDAFDLSANIRTICVLSKVYLMDTGTASAASLGAS
jgi:hypothetical protein